MRKISKKQIGAMGLAVMMTAQSTAMAAEIETSQTENTVVTQKAPQKALKKRQQSQKMYQPQNRKQLQNRRLFQSKILLLYKKQRQKKM